MNAITMKFKSHETALLLFALDALDRENGKAMPQSVEMREFIAKESKTLRERLHRADVDAAMNRTHPALEPNKIVPITGEGGFAAYDCRLR